MLAHDFEDREQLEIVLEDELLADLPLLVDGDAFQSFSVGEDHHQHFQVAAVDDAEGLD